MHSDAFSDRLTSWLTELTVTETTRHKEYDKRLAYLFKHFSDWQLCMRHVCLIIELGYTHALRSLLSNVPFRIEDIFCRCGFFQDAIDRNAIDIVACLLENAQVKLFYTDIIRNLLQRQSPIIRSQRMFNVLSEALF